MPLLCAWAAARYLGAGAVEVDTTAIAIAMFAITAVPVVLGLFINQFLHGVAQRIEPTVSAIATGLFVVIVIAALASNWGVFIGALGSVGPLLIVMNLLLLALGVAVARGLGLLPVGALAIATEMGVQNATLGIAVAGIIAGVAGIGALGVPSATYGITMYLVSLPVLMALRAWVKRSA